MAIDSCSVNFQKAIKRPLPWQLHVSANNVIATFKQICQLELIAINHQLSVALLLLPHYSCRKVDPKPQRG